MTKYKININRPKISTEEIVQQKDFNIVWKKYKKEKHSALKINWATICLLLLLLLMVIIMAVRIIKDIEDSSRNDPKAVSKEVKAEIEERIRIRMFG